MVEVDESGGYRRYGRDRVPRVRHPAQWQHAAVRAAQRDRSGGRAGRVLRGAALAPGCPASPRQYFGDPSSSHDIAARLGPANPVGPRQAGEFEGWFTYALQRGTSPNGVFGAKMMWNYFDDFRDRVAGASRARRRHLQPRPSTSSFPQLRSCSSAGATRWPRPCRCGRQSRPSNGATRLEPSHDELPGRVRLPRAEAPRQRAAPLGRPLGGLVPRHRPRTDSGHLRGVRRHAEPPPSAGCSTRWASTRPSRATAAR